MLTTVHWQHPSEWTDHRHCSQSGLHAVARQLLLKHVDSLCTILEWLWLLRPVAALAAPLNSNTDTRR